MAHDDFPNLCLLWIGHGSVSPFPFYSPFYGYMLDSSHISDALEASLKDFSAPGTRSVLLGDKHAVVALRWVWDEPLFPRSLPAQPPDTG